MYHSIEGQLGKGCLQSCLDLAEMVVKKETFESQIKYLSQHYNIISLEEFQCHAFNNAPLKPNSVILTFDDGFIDNYTYAYPILKKYGCHATFFPIGNSLNDKGEVWLHWFYFLLDNISTDRISIELDGDKIIDSQMNSESDKLSIIKHMKFFLEKSSDTEKYKVAKELGKYLPANLKHYKDNYLSVDEIQELSANGFSFGGHTMSHPKMANLSFERKKTEIEQTKSLLSSIINCRLCAFSYPHGQKTDFDQQDKQLLKDNGFTCALTTVEGLNDKDTDIFELKRIEVGEFSHYEFILHLTGVFGTAKTYFKNLLKR